MPFQKSERQGAAMWTKVAVDARDDPILWVWNESSRAVHKLL